MPGVKTNERPGVRAVLRHSRMSASKARQVLDLIRGEDVDRATELLRLTEREAAFVVGKVLASAVANAVHNDGLDAEELYVSACFADEGATLKRWRPRARGRASRINKRTCHITVIVDIMPEERLARQRADREAVGARRARRVAGSRTRADLSQRFSRRRAAQAAAAAEAEEAEHDEDVEGSEGLEETDALDATETDGADEGENDDDTGDADEAEDTDDADTDDAEEGHDADDAAEEEKD
jgi:large subunit ribosomal protein L22